ncbi:MAG: MaoC/PaaZ C-terminal domain-containing protein [Pseudomonadales bacterium]|nr:MaoC/PaaZ C-terminal domain-containing protein [Pseudomonadales bacterium]
MPLDAAIVGQSIPAERHSVDARWLMAYAASLNDPNPAYMDTQTNAVVAHPVFPVCVEWPVILNTRALAGSQSLTDKESARGVHAAHDLHIHAPIKAGDKLSTSATMIGVNAIKPGAAYTMKLTTTNQTGKVVAETYQLGIYRNVDVTGENRFSEDPPELPTRSDPTQGTRSEIYISGGAAHTYTECAHIWNPIHTDKAVALAAGLPDIILHGTATLALAVTNIIDKHADSNPGRVTRLGGRFAAMVLMPSTIIVESHQVDNIVSYHVFTEDGDTAISGGFVCLD